MLRTSTLGLAGALLMWAITPSALALAIGTGPGSLIASVDSSAIYNPGTGAWDYGYTVHNDFSSDQVIDGLILPFFDPECVALTCTGGVGDVITPSGWDWRFVDRGNLVGPDPWQGDPSDLYVPGFPPEAFVDPPFALEFFFNPGPLWVLPIEPGNSLGGFGFASPYGPADGPVLLRANTSFSVDPLMPASPNFPVPVPEPATITLIGLGLAGLGYRRRRTSH